MDRRVGTKPGSAGPCTRLAAVAAVALVLSASTAPGEGGAAVQVPRTLAQREARFAALVSESRLRAVVRRLVAQGARTGGTPAGDAAAAFVADAFRASGLEVSVLDDPPAEAYWPERWLVTVGPERHTLTSAWPYGRSPSLEPALTGPLVFLASLVDKTPADWRGQVVYTREASSHALSRVASSVDPPIAILTSAPHQEGRFVEWARLGHLPAGSRVRAPVFALSLRDGLRAEEAARAGHSAEVSLAAQVRLGRPRTVIASWPGSAQEPFVLVTAHGDADSGGPGADDNASGVSVVLEVATALRALATDDRPDPWPFAVKFVVWGSEYDSARAYVEREGDRLARCLAVVNVDQAGTGAEREAIYFEGNNVPWNEPLLRLFERVGEEYRGRDGYWPEFATTPTQGGTDAYAFLPSEYEGLGLTAQRVPAVTVYTAAWDESRRLVQTPGWAIGGPGDGSRVIVDYSRYYHSSGDTPENTTEQEPQNMVRAAKAIGLVLLRLADQRDTASTLAATPRSPLRN